MSESNELSPWVHPKAQKWFQAMFRRTNLLMALEDELAKPDEQLTPEVVRIILAISVLIGREEIWPEGDRDILKKIMRKAQDISKRPPQSSSGKPLTVAEHQSHSKSTGALAIELELVRRRVGVSVRKTDVGTPKSWEPFWQ